MIDMSKKYQTRDGTVARILCTDADGERPVVGMIDGCIYRWRPDGTYGNGCNLEADLIEFVPTITRYNALVVACGVSKDEGRVVIGGGSSEPVAAVRKGSRLVGYLKSTQPVGNEDPDKIVFEVVPVPT